MIDDEELVYALRNNVGVSDYSRVAANLAADRIEQLLEGNKGLADAFATVSVKREMTEAKLAKAVAALTALANMKTAGDSKGAVAMAWHAREVLAKLEKTE